VLVSTLILIFPVAMIIAGLTDLFTYKIPNKISIVLAASFLVWALAIEMPLQRFGLHIAVGALVLIAGFALFSYNIIGGGDAKLLAAGALWMGHTETLSFVFLTGLVGGLLALALMSYRAIVPPPFLARQSWAMRLHEKAGGMPYGAAIAISALWLFPTTIWVQATTRWTTALAS
jgi:prepilin peptidase CpaA